MGKIHFTQDSGIASAMDDITKEAQQLRIKQWIFYNQSEATVESVTERFDIDEKTAKEVIDAALSIRCVSVSVSVS